MAHYFSEEEVKGLDPKLVDLLDNVREHAGIPIVITCGLRTVEHNDAIGGVPDSAHEKGLAVDIHCPDSQTRYKLVKAALAMSVRRIEVATAHIHIDIDDTKPQDVIFLGISK